MGVLSWPRGATPHPRSGAEAGRTPCLKGGGLYGVQTPQGKPGVGTRAVPVRLSDFTFT